MKLPAMLPLISSEEYNAIDGIRSSRLKDLLKSPAHYRHSLIHPKEPTPAMVLGTAIHAAILEPKRFKSDYVISPKFDRRTKDGKAEAEKFSAENVGKIIVDEERYRILEGCVNAVYGHEIASKELAIGHAEVAYLWEDKGTGLKCKIKPDFVRPEHRILVDVKTTTDASPSGFARIVANLKYHMQAAFYLDGISAATGAEYKTFRIVAVETAQPHAVAVYELSEESLQQGRLLYQRALSMLAECEALQIWPSYTSDIYSLSIPRWANFLPEVNDETA
jgi:hypothetical protein